MESTAQERVYIAIDLKSFFASVECVERKLDPLKTNLVVADAERTEKTICLAVSPALKAYGIPGRARLFEVVQAVRGINRRRMSAARSAGLAVRVAPGDEIPSFQPAIASCTPEKAQPVPDYVFRGASCDADELAADPGLELTYIIAKPQMHQYMRCSTQVFGIYMRYIAPEDIHVYSIDECFLDVTAYLNLYGLTPRELAAKMIREVLRETGVTATCGIGPNLYLCKVALDIVAKHVPADENGVRIAELTADEYRKQLWTHEPLTDFWRVGHGIAAKLNAMQIYTMGDIARCSLGAPGSPFSADRLYKLFGINAELLIDHAWGEESCTIADIRSYCPENHSLSRGQVLSKPYPYEKGLLIIREMADMLTLEMVDKGVVADQIVLTVCYDAENSEPGETHRDRYGRRAPKPVHGSINLGEYTASTKLIMEKTAELYARITDPHFTVRRMYLVFNHVLDENTVTGREQVQQLDFFTDAAALTARQEKQQKAREKEKALQKAMLDIKKKYGKNAILRGMDFEEDATARERNAQVGGHKA